MCVACDDDRDDSSWTPSSKVDDKSLAFLEDDDDHKYDDGMTLTAMSAPSHHSALGPINDRFLLRHHHVQQHGGDPCGGGPGGRVSGGEG